MTSVTHIYELRIIILYVHCHKYSQVKLGTAWLYILLCQLNLQPHHVTNFMQFVYNCHYLFVVIVLCLYDIVGVDDTMVVTLKFSKDRMAVFTCSSGLNLPNDAVIVGTTGTIRVGGHYSIKYN